MANGKFFFWTDKGCPDPDPKWFILDPTPDPDPQHCLDVSVCLLYSGLYVPGGVGTSHGRICSTAACAMPGGVWPTAASAAPQLSVYKSLRYTRLCPSTRAFVCTWGVCLPESVWTYVCPSTGDFVCTWGVCLQDHVLHLRACPSTRAFMCTWGVCL